MPPHLYRFSNSHELTCGNDGGHIIGTFDFRKKRQPSSIFQRAYFIRCQERPRTDTAYYSAGGMAEN